MKTDKCFSKEDLCAWLRDQVSEAQHKRIQEHIQVCTQCREALSELRETVERLESGPDFTVSHNLSPQILDQIDCMEKKERRFAFFIRIAALVVLTAGLTRLFLTLTPNPRPPKPGQKIQTAERTTPVAASLQWLASRQQADGSWGTDSPYKTAITGLALISFLKADSDLHQKHIHTIQKAAQFIRKSQTEKGRYGQAGSYSAYNHALATAAMVNYRRLYPDTAIRKSAIKAVSCITQTQDSSQNSRILGTSSRIPEVIWETYALIEARNNGWNGLENAINTSIQWLEKSRRNQGRNIDMAGQMLGTADPEKESLIRFFLLADSRAGTDNSKHISGRDFSRYFFLTQALGHSTDNRARQWIKDIRENVSRLQGIDGKWKPAHASQNTGGLVYSTALATLCLL